MFLGRNAERRHYYAWIPLRCRPPQNASLGGCPYQKLPLTVNALDQTPVGGRQRAEKCHWLLFIRCKSNDLDLEATLQFLPTPDAKKLEKSPMRRRKLWIVVGLVAAAAALSLLTGLLVWRLHLHRDVAVTRVYVGSMAIANQRFLPDYEDPGSGPFAKMASLVSQQLRVMYNANTVLGKYFRRTSVETFSDDGGDTVTTYYHSEFDIPASQLASVDAAIQSLQTAAGSQQSRQGRVLLKPQHALDIDSVVARAIDPRMTSSSLLEGGVIQSPGFPDSSYPSDVYLEWRLRADAAYRVRLDFQTLILEDDCQHDFVKIYDSLAPIEQTAIAEHCGIPHRSLSFVSSGSVMLVTLVTNEAKNFPGFIANFSQVPLAPPADCGGPLSGDVGIFSSPFFPSSYPPRTACVWNIQVSKGKLVKVKFRKFYIGNDSNDCSRDYVEVNGRRLCGAKVGSTAVASRSNRMTVKFNSDWSYVDQGFFAAYEAFTPSDSCPGRFRCTNDLCVDSRVRCDSVDDCGDASDEDDCGTCAPNVFRCRNGRCVLWTMVCNGKDDCADGSDEFKCEKSVAMTTCPDSSFRCRNGRCVDKVNPECDGDDDCEDASDEESCQCGSEPYRSSRIVGGEAAQEDELPWQVSLHVAGQGHACGASVLSSRWLLTAAHCVQDKGSVRHSQADQWEAFLGQHELSRANEWTVRRKVMRIVAHRDFDQLTFDNDVALMELESDVPLNQHIWPICLPSPAHRFPDGQEAWITGWGATREGGAAVNILQKAKVHIINSSVCNNAMNNEVKDGMLCAGVLKGGVDACQGDSGGPLSVISPSRRVFLAGVVSWGNGCARRNKPGIYTRVTRYRSWIKEHSGV
ncbi:suppressor of tumorigenicity 14 protein-like isoform X3 [Phycodurus eques]|uniref:suppressor of tumorigenicity 14 protein-like isoform X3 n=1 Tax=Phycodurus eques TaxID=693459 RepID=UPI002ACE1CC1|nr:suppressor of tumorigenicity 14 protein-like isoform X3 [Phycodurus eques]